MGMTRHRRGPPRSPPLSSRQEAALTFLAGGSPPQTLLPLPPAMAPVPPGVVPHLLSQVHQNDPANCEATINRQINLVHLSIAFYFHRPDTALKHFATFLWQSREEREQAQALMRLHNQRGGRLRLPDVRRPARNQWESGLSAKKNTLHVERIVNQSPRSLFHLATDKNDAHLCDFLEHHHLLQDVKFINFGANILKLPKLGAPESSLAESDTSPWVPA